MSTPLTDLPAGGPPFRRRSILIIDGKRRAGLNAAMAPRASSPSQTSPPTSRNPRPAWVEWFLHPRLSENARLVALSMVVGVTTGLAGAGFGWLIEFFQALFYGEAGHAQTVAWWRYPLVLAVGGLGGGLLIHNLAREAKGHGVPEVMAAVAMRGGAIRRRVAAVKALASAICLGSGGSAGREGPIVQIGSALGSGLGQATGMSRNRLKVMVGCGAAGGIAAVFNAPIAGVMFAVEVILGDFGAFTLTPVILSAVLAAVTSHMIVGEQPVFTIPTFETGNPLEVPLFLLLGVVTGVVAVAYTRILYWVEDGFDLKLPIHPILKPALGGALLGALALFYHQVLGDGYATIEHALHGELQLTLLLALVVTKLVATCLTLGSGNSGGIFAPSLFLGAMVGGAFGLGVEAQWPSVVGSPGAYALAGMAGIVAGSTHATITAILILFEMSGDYRMMLPLMLTAAAATLVAGRLYPESIYTLKLARRGINLRQGREVGVMASLQVSEVMKSDPEVVPAHMDLSTLVEFARQSSDSSFPVVDQNRRLTGIVSVQDIREVLDENIDEDTAHLVVAQDIATLHPVFVTPEATLNDAMAGFGRRDVRYLPVVDNADNQRLVGVVDRGAVIGAYNRALLDQQRGD